MSVLAWLIISSVLMGLASIVGALTLAVKEAFFKRIILILVAFSAGALLGGAFFHLIPESVATFGNSLWPYFWIILGFLAFFVLEQFIHWHHCHRLPSQHVHPVSYLVLIADSLHNFIDGLVLAGAFIVNIQLGLVTLLAILAHEVPQELGDFGVLVHSGWSKGRALLFNFLSSLTFLAGALIVYLMAKSINVDFLLPFAAGNFIYIAAADLVPEINKSDSILRNLTHFTAFLAGLALLFAIRFFLHE